MTKDTKNGIDEDPPETHGLNPPSCHVKDNFKICIHTLIKLLESTPLQEPKKIILICAIRLPHTNQSTIYIF